jgi:hypothetical protein
VPYFGEKSQAHLAQMDRRLVAVCRKVILIEDFSITCSVRDGETQNQLFMDGLSKARAGQSPHHGLASNRHPSSRQCWYGQYIVGDVTGVRKRG